MRRRRDRWAVIAAALAATAAAAAIVLATVGGGSVGTRAAEKPMLWVSPSGSDVTCVRGNASLPCASYQRAYALAQSGDLVQVAPGSYPATNPAGNAIEINPSNGSLSGYVTFVCQPGAAADSVDQASNAFNLAIRANWVAFKGSCFHFRVLHVNYPGDSGLGADHVLIDGVHMDSFQLSGAHDTTIENSQIGPILSCYGNVEGTPATRCSNYANFPATWQAVAEWWAQTPSGGSTGQQTEPYIHDRGNGSDLNQCSHNVSIVHDVIHDVQATDSAVNHTGGLLIDGSACQSWDHNLLISRSVFEHNMSYGIEMDGPMSGTIVQNNWIGQGFGSLGAGGSLNMQQDVGRGDSLEAGCRGGQHTVSDMLIRYNSADGYIAVNGNGDSSASGCWTDVRVIGNIYANSVFGGIGCGGINSSYGSITMQYNVVRGAVCGTKGKLIRSWPYVSTAPTALDFDLRPGRYTFRRWVPNSGADYRLTTDAHNADRTFPTAAGAVAPHVSVPTQKRSAKRSR